MADMNEPTESTINPHLQLDGMGKSRYPNQFFDMAQQYMPPTIKELFRWCTFYYYNSPLIGSTISKISRYPITDLIFEDDKETIRDIWDGILNKGLKIKDRLMEINLDYHVYGNAFVSIHLPFTRFLICPECGHRAPIKQWKWSFLADHYSFRGQCSECGHDGSVTVKDSPYKDKKSVRIIRWNPENIYIKHNEYTGKRIYMYSVPHKLRTAINRGDKDIIEDVPIIVLQALRKRRMIRFNNDNFMHLRRPTLAEQDQGWGKPLIIHVMKDMYYLYTLRRAQEAIALEHIVPFDIIYPLPNAQQDPYVHTDLGNWKVRIEDIIRRHRKDPNYKGVIPVPVGFGRVGGDGKALLVTPEINILTQQIVGGMGIPQEFLFGGLNFTGSSVNLRTLENDFIQNRSQLLDFVIWLKDKIRIWLNLPDIQDIRFADFRMADDVQRNQQLIGLNAQMKISDQTLLTELGYDWEQEQQKMIEEVFFQNYLNDLRAKGSAKTQGESMLIQQNYQQKIQDMVAKAQEKAQEKAQAMGQSSPMLAGNVQILPGAGGQGLEGQGGGGMGWEDTLPAPLAPQDSGAPLGQTAVQEGVEQAIDTRVNRWAQRLHQMNPNDASMTIQTLKVKLPTIGTKVEEAYNMMAAEMSGASPGPGGRSTDRANPNVNMNPMPTQKAPMRAGAV